MLVGIMHRSKRPPLIAKVTALMSSYHKIDIIYLRPWDVDMKNGTVKGSMYKNNKWVPVKKNLPPLMDIASGCFKKDTTEIMNYLRENSILTFDKKNTPNKEELQNELSNDNQFSHLIIPTKRLDSFESLEIFLSEYSSIIIKPLYGKQGMNIYSLRRQDRSYILNSEREEKELNYDELFEYYQNFLVNKKYILQKLVESRTVSDDPFDCRIIVQKNGQGKWIMAKMFFRIGIGQKIVSNTSQGGSIIDTKPFLKANFKDQWNDIYHNLKGLSVTLPNKIEEIKRTPTMDLGFDIGIDKNGALYLFESNNGASKKLIISESAMLRLDYYQYLYRTHPRLKQKNIGNNEMLTEEINNQSQKIQDQVLMLTRERDQYRKRLNQLEDSRSWHITSPIRKISSYLKRIGKH